MKKELENYEQWLVKEEIKKEGTAESYKRAIPKLEEHYQQFTGRNLNFLNLSVEELNPIVQAYRQEGKYAAFGDISNGTYRNALNALLRYKQWQQNSLQPATPLKILHLLQTPYFQKLLVQEEFYYQKLLDLYEQYKSFDTATITQEIDDLLDTVTQGDFSFQGLLDSAKGILKEYLQLLGNMIAIFDEKGYNKKLWNPYEDKRNVSRSMVNQRDWTRFLLGYQHHSFSKEYLANERLTGIKYSINFIENPETSLNIVSKNHRKDIQAYFGLHSEEELITLFSDELKTLVNPKNKGVIISKVLYNTEIKKEWIRGINGLMAADGTGWLDNFAKASRQYEYSIVWNSKKPSGTAITLKGLQEIIDRGEEFTMYYASKGNDSKSYVRYVAIIKDFAESANTYKVKNWGAIYGNKIYEYQPSFEKYIEENNNKKASIVFLCSGFYKIEPIPVEEFEFYGNYSPPRQDNLSPIKSEPTFQILEIEGELEEEINEATKQEMEKATNQILYGPPGTGKTYQTKKLAVELIDKKDYGDSEEDRKEIVNRYNQLYEKEQIVFTTFHQSMSYEDFVEGIKPKTEEKQVTYEVEDGIFKKIVTEALYSIAQEVKEERISEIKDFSVLYDMYLNKVSEQLETEDKVTIPTRSGKIHIVEISQQGNFLLEHDNGARRYTVSKDRLLKLNKGIPNCKEVTNINDEFRKVIGGSNASAYWAVLKELQELKADSKTKAITNDVSYEEKLDIIASLTEEDYKKGKGKPYVLIVDEINRGNVSAIFGELITLLEADKRLGQNETITVKLPYSKTEFGVPANLHIIGTMNTADRSVEALDTALRRRFEFTEVMPNPGKLKEITFEKDEQKFNLQEVLKTINDRIEVLIDRDHTIGHSYFIKIKSDDTEALASAFNNKVIPLLQEYFYGDYGKIGLVLGSGFVTTSNTNNDLFKGFDYGDKDNLRTITYKLIKRDKDSIMDALWFTLGKEKRSKKAEEQKHLGPS